MSLATPTALLPVTLSAEDDCGISRLQLFRSLNDSRPLSLDLPRPPRPPRRIDETVRLPLARYGLEPGDVIKLFGRVEDNDPAGAKGAESPVAAVRIVSQEEFERMFRAGRAFRRCCRNTTRRGGGWNRWRSRWTICRRSWRSCRPARRPPRRRGGKSSGSSELLRREAAEIADVGRTLPAL